MPSSRILLLMLGIVTSYLVGPIEASEVDKLFEKLSMDDSKLKQATLSEQPANSKATCALQCAGHAQCVTFTFLPGENGPPGQCWLYGEPADTGNVEPSQGARSYELSVFEISLHQPCDGMSHVCEDGLSCDPNTNECNVPYCLAGGAGGHMVRQEDWRSTTEVWVDNNYHCDSLGNGFLEGWYRFFLQGTNAVIPTVCQPADHCTAVSPIALDLEGQLLPGADQEITCRACSIWSTNCCNRQYPVTVRNCGTYYVYNLTYTSHCALAYCVEPQ